MKFPLAFGFVDIIMFGVPQMFGEKNHWDMLMEALKEGKVSRDDLLESASRVYDMK